MGSSPAAWRLDRGPGGVGHIETAHLWAFLGTSQLVLKGLLHGLQQCVLPPAGPI